MVYYIEESRNIDRYPPRHWEKSAPRYGLKKKVLGNHRRRRVLPGGVGFTKFRSGTPRRPTAKTKKPESEQKTRVISFFFIFYCTVPDETRLSIGFVTRRFSDQD